MNLSYQDNTINKTIEQLAKKIYTQAGNLTATAYITKEPVPFKERMSGEKKKINLSESWGEIWDCAWFHLTGELPKGMDEKDLILSIDVSGEGLVVDVTGNPVQGVTTTQSTFDAGLGRPGKKYVNLSDIGMFTDTVDIWIDCGCNDLFGYYTDSGRLKDASLVTCNQKIHQLYYDFLFLKNLTSCMKDVSYQLRIKQSLYQGAILLQDEKYQEEAVEKVIQSFKKFLNISYRYSEDFKVAAVGHAHIDLAWLWPIRETKRKAARTFSTALKMMERYPDYIFGASQPQMFAWVKEQYPVLYERIKDAIDKKRLECQGGMWVEADTNISGGEALMRQFFYGKKFFMEEFNQDMKILWLPDVFGYSAAMPQIMKHAEIDYFMTIKLSWSEHNVFPYHTFLWSGIDGSSILSHMPPEGTYNSAARPESYQRTIDHYKEKSVSDEALLLFGIGDGGGGPGEEHLENLKRAKTSVGVPIVKQQPAIEFFKSLEKGKENYKSWRGELYLEKHQGTYTTHAKNKQFNRKMEFALRECEFACTLAKQYINADYPRKELETIWKEVLLYQFHDILPGSSIQRVYEESLGRYEILYQQTKELIEKTYQNIAAYLPTKENKQWVVCFNSLSWERKEDITVDGKTASVIVPPMGWAIYDMDTFTAEEIQNKFLLEETKLLSENVSSEKLSEEILSEKISLISSQEKVWTLENSLTVISFALDGTISSYYDKEKNRELVPNKKALNQYVLYEDEGDCWDIPFGYRDHSYETAVLIKAQKYQTQKEQGMIQFYQLGESSFKVRLQLKEAEKELRISMEIDWKEQGKMLRVQFPLEIETDTASCEIQFGHIERKIHTNTSWDLARIEVPAHKWVDISETEYGVAILNDCKYGYHIEEKTIDLDILRSPGYPSKEEKGLHTLNYVILPHTSSLGNSDVIQKAYELNSPLTVIKPEGAKESKLSQTDSFFQIKSENIIAEAVKAAEDERGYIIRLYEAKGARTISQIDLKNAKEVILSNALEKDLERIPVENGSICLEFSAFEIKTIRVI